MKHILQNIRMNVPTGAIRTEAIRSGAPAPPSGTMHFVDIALLACAAVLVCTMLASCDTKKWNGGGAQSQSTTVEPAPAPPGDSVPRRIGEMVAFINDGGWLCTDAVVEAEGHDMVLVQRSDGRMAGREWRSAQEYAAWSGPTPTRVVERSALMYKVRVPRARSSELLWVQAERLYTRRQPRTWSVGDTVLGLRFGRPPDTAVVTALPASDGGDYSVHVEGYTGDDRYPPLKLIRTMRTVTPADVRPGMLLLDEYERDVLVIATDGRRIRVRSRFGSSDEWVDPARLRSVE